MLQFPKNIEPSDSISARTHRYFLTNIFEWARSFAYHNNCRRTSTIPVRRATLFTAVYLDCASRES
ncbi:unnamed protein product [Acanthoscelides obtectus]|nr:unnamed protein product [Acanthoscelides obtectus]CAK1622256.1 hypothetical protein AOBTE_LOCUS1403 [Acanthoscelides obtectus]